MEIKISDTRTILDVQREFNKEFPSLKIEFLSVPYNNGLPSIKANLYNSDRKLSQCRKVHNEGKLDVNANWSVSNLEKELWEKFGLSALIFRKSGKLWIEISLTESWTLQKQNMEGMEWSRHINNHPDNDATDPLDRDQWQ